uniref:C2H2-type domain-containing protein n=1 Tax=Oryzias latipes TaxID=8090 RepID=A0A3P9JYX9_ORYLA
QDETFKMHEYIELKAPTDSVLSELDSSRDLKWPLQTCPISNHLLPPTSESPLLCSPSNVRFLLLCSSGPHGFREEAGSKDSPEPQRDSELDDQQIEVKKTADKSAGERRKKRVCKVCGCCYKSLGSLIKHTTYDKVHKCEECGKTFNGLSLHRWSHTEERPYKCDLCDKAFGLKSLLKAHRRSHDENQCHICRKTGDEMPCLSPSWHRCWPAVSNCLRCLCTSAATSL